MLSYYIMLVGKTARKAKYRSLPEGSVADLGGAGVQDPPPPPFAVNFSDLRGKFLNIFPRNNFQFSGTAPEKLCCGGGGLRDSGNEGGFTRFDLPSSHLVAG